MLKRSFQFIFVVFLLLTPLLRAETSPEALIGKGMSKLMDFAIPKSYTIVQSYSTAANINTVMKKIDFVQLDKFRNMITTYNNGSVQFLQKMIIDGKTIWLIIPEKTIVVKTPYNEAYNNFSKIISTLINAVTSGFSFELLNSEIVNEVSCDVIKLTPNIDAGIKNIYYYLCRDDGHIVRIKTVLPDEKTKSIDIVNYKENPALSSKDFEYAPPQDYKIIEAGK